MKQKRRLLEVYGLRKRFALTLLFSGLLCAAVFCGLHFVSDALLTAVFERSDFEQHYRERQIKNLQDYITDNQISTADLQQLKRWEKKQPLILLELFTEDGCLYSSSRDVPEEVLLYENAVYQEWEHTFSVQLRDRSVTAVLYADPTYQFFVLGNVAAFTAALLLFVVLFLRSSGRMIRYICKLNEAVQILEGGDLTYPVPVQGNDELTDLARSMNRMRLSFQEQLQREQELHEASRKLIAEMFHDLRTPLTGLMLYTEILRTHRYETPAELDEYLTKIDAKAHRMKLLSDHLFEYSLEGMKPNLQESRPFEAVLEKPLAELLHELNDMGYPTAAELQWRSCFIQAKPEYIECILENIGSNIRKYAQPETEVRIETLYSEQYCGLLFMNTCLAEPQDTVSNGIGLESIRTMMQQMGGRCTVEQTEAAFEVMILFRME